MIGGVTECAIDEDSDGGTAKINKKSLIFHSDSVY